MITDTQKASYQWLASPSSSSMSRNLTNLERMFVVLNKDLFGQNCPFIGASISLIPSSPSTTYLKFTLSSLESRARIAFAQTRYRYPTIAARVDSSELKAIYHVETPEEVADWTNRTVKMVGDEGGWVAVRERMSRESPIPSVDGDYCVMYIITRPGEDGMGLQSFDVLMHTHHVFTDGSGIRSILNEFLERLASPLETEMVWGKEVERLFPPSCVLVKDEEPEKEDGVEVAKAGGIRLKGFDIGLPVHQPNLGPPSALLRGTKLSAHTFSSPTFLPQLLTAGRKHGVKLASLLHAALLLAVHQSQPTNTVPGAKDWYRSGSALDMRNGWLRSPFDQKKEYVNSAVAIHPIEVPCHIFDAENGFWEAAKRIGGLWEEIKVIKGMADVVERDAGAFVENWGKQNGASSLVPAKPRTCPYFVSDPPGEHLLSPVFAGKELEFVIDSYQLATDQNQAVVSARSHSWNGQLTLCLVYNAARNPSDKMDEFLGRWRAIVENICEGRI